MRWLGWLVNTFTTYAEYARHNSENLLRPPQMQLFKSEGYFAGVFLRETYSSSISEIIDFARRGYLNA